MISVSKTWADYRTLKVFYKGKKVKLRHYITVNAAIMKHLNKPGWEGRNHYENYKKAVCFYGLAGIKYYENRFYRDLPMPAERGKLQKMYYSVKNFFVRLKIIIKWIINL